MTYLLSINKHYKIDILDSELKNIIKNKVYFKDTEYCLHIVCFFNELYLKEILDFCRKNNINIKDVYDYYLKYKDKDKFFKLKNASLEKYFEFN